MEPIHEMTSPRRQPLLAIVYFIFLTIERLVRQLAPLVLIYFISPRRTGSTWEYIFIGISALGILRSFVDYYFFTYWVSPDNQQFHIEKGLINRQKINVPFDKIQTVNLKESLAHRILGLAQVELDTAGSKNSEVSIPALDKKTAEALHYYLLTNIRKDEALPRLHNRAPGLDQEATPDFHAKTVNELTETPILSISPGDLFKIGLGQNHLRMVGVVLGTAFGFSQLFTNDYDPRVFVKLIEQFVPWFSYDSVLGWLVLGVGVLLVAFILSLANTLIRYYGFKVLNTSQGFRSRAGLLTRYETIIHLRRIQMAEWWDNPLLRRFGMQGLAMKQAKGEETNLKESMRIPGSLPEALQEMRRRWWPQFQEENLSWGGTHPSMAFRFWFYRALVPALVFSITMVIFKRWWLLAFLWLLTGVAYFLYKKHQRTWKVGLSEQGCQLEFGFWRHNHMLLPWDKVQGITISQGIYQRKHNLANLVFYTAAGSVVIPYQSLAKSVAITNYVLAHVEQKQPEWM